MPRKASHARLMKGPNLDKKHCSGMRSVAFGHSKIKFKLHAVQGLLCRTAGRPGRDNQRMSGDYSGS